MNENPHVLRACPCCGGFQHTPVHDNRMAPIGGIDMSYRVAECGICGLLHADMLPPSNIYTHYYQTLSKYDQIASIAGISPVDVQRADTTIALCALHLGKDEGIADLGCGVGYLLHRFREAGWRNVHGIDPAPSAQERARSLFGLEGVCHGLLTDARERLPLQQTGIVCLTGVLEHLWAPLDDLRLLFASLRPGTRVLIEVPALERFERPPYEPFGEFSLEHIQYFSARSLENLMRAAGAEPLSIQLLDLDASVTDSLLGLFNVSSEPARATFPAPAAAESASIRAYLEGSSHLIDAALGVLAGTPGPWIVYGAGSHTARLLPMLADQNLDQRIMAIVDGNANLHGQMMGRWKVAAPSLLEAHPDATVVISSFRSQSAIHLLLSKRYPNPLRRLYLAPEAP